MPDLSFAVESVQPLAAASPHLGFALSIVENGVAAAEETAIQSVMLQCQIRLEPARRRYSAEEQSALIDLFGAPELWDRTLRSILWTHCNVNVAGFRGSTRVELPVACTYDFNIAATRYFHALRGGDVLLNLLFSGTIFYAAENGGLQIAPIGWDKEANFRLPLQTWKRMMEQYYPNMMWLSLSTEVFERLYRYRSRHALTSWEQAVEVLLAASGEQV